MTAEHVITRRLSFIKYFYNLSLEQSYKPSPQNSISVLMFHDCVELFLILAAEKLNAAVRDKMYILDYINAINVKLEEVELTQNVSIKRLNNARIAFKHSGILLEESEIESLRIAIRLFLDENMPVIFDINFDDISMIDLIENPKVKKIMKDAQYLLHDGEFKKSIEHIAIAYKVLIKEYEISKEVLGTSIFNTLGKQWRFFGFGAGREISENEKKIAEALENINNALKPLFFGIDYRKYVKFISITPDIVDYIGVYPDNGINLEENYYNKFRIIWFRNRGEQEYKKEDIEYCLDFLIETSLKLQEFDFSLEE